MPAKPSGEEKTGIIRKKQRNGDIYVYMQKTVYDPEKKYNRVLERSLLYKIPKGSEEAVPTRPRRKAGGSGSAAGLHAGMADIIDYFGRTSGIDADLYAAADRIGGGRSVKEACRDIAEKSVSMARYLLATDGQDLLGMREWRHSGSFSCGMPEQVICWVLRNVGERDFQDGFFGERIRRLGTPQAVAYLLKSVAGDPMRHSGTRHSMDSGSLHGRNFLVYCSQGTGQPLAFTDFAPDGIWRSATGRERINGEWLEKSEFVIDDGCCTEERMAEYIRDRVPFIVPVDAGLSWVRREIDANMKKLVSKRSLCPFQPEIHGVSVRLLQRFGGTRTAGGIYLHLYYSPLAQKEGGWKYAGFSALVSRRKNSPSECLRKYRANERTGYFFEAGKRHVDSVRMCAWGRMEAAGLAFVQFLALCYYEHIREEIHKFRPGLGKPDGNPAHDTEENLSAETRLGEWLDRTPVYRQLQRFDTDGGQDDGETAAFKRLYLEKIGMGQHGRDEY